MAVIHVIASRSAIVVCALFFARRRRSPPPRKRRSCWCRIEQFTTSRLARRAITPRSRRCAGASSTTSTATLARAIRCNFARSRSSTPARARSPPATCAPPPGKAATPSASNSARRISSIRISSTRSTAMPSMAPAPPPSISPSRSEGARHRRRRGVSDPAYGADHRGGARRQGLARLSGV